MVYVILLLVGQDIISPTNGALVSELRPPMGFCPPLLALQEILLFGLGLWMRLKGRVEGVIRPSAGHDGRKHLLESFPQF